LSNEAGKNEVTTSNNKVGQTHLANRPIASFYRWSTLLRKEEKLLTDPGNSLALLIPTLTLSTIACGAQSLH
jgi:hypothetical protein